MAIRTIAELKSYFQGVPVTDRPSAQNFTDLFDTLQWYEDMANAALAAASPVIIVPDQATMLANGPTYAVGQRVKHTDEGLTWVKQQQTGSVIGDWAPIGDSAITIPDVLNLQTELDKRFTRDVFGETCLGRLGVRNISQPQIGMWNMLGTSPTEVFADPWGPSFSYGAAALTEDAILKWQTLTVGSFIGHSVTGFLYNNSIVPINVSLDAGMLGTNGSWPVNLGAGKWMSVTMTWINHPIEGNIVLVAYNNEI
jgi:hypothetical protein